MAEHSRVEITDSILNHAPKDAVTWSADKFREFTERVGYSGIAFLPIRSVLGWDILRGRDKGLVREIYQSYREVSILGAVGKAMGKIPSARESRDANRAQGVKGMLKLGAMPIFDLGMNLDMPTHESQQSGRSACTESA